ncbi:uncharacterized protein PG998_010357 [Apiospora kogelbergensis]|uniref:uncharacterized protein n=1 Tax=Apiospora kogelbergensis TaxID=1337665 RepID=UPI00312DF298
MRARPLRSADHENASWSIDTSKAEDRMPLVKINNGVGNDIRIQTFQNGTQTALPANIQEQWCAEDNENPRPQTDSILVRHNEFIRSDFLDQALPRSRSYTIHISLRSPPVLACSSGTKAEAVGVQDVDEFDKSGLQNELDTHMPWLCPLTTKSLHVHQYPASR